MEGAGRRRGEGSGAAHRVDRRDAQPSLEEAFLAFYEAGPDGATRERRCCATTLREQRRAFLGWAIGLAAVAAMYAAFYPSIRDSAADLQGYLDKLPKRSGT